MGIPNLTGASDMRAVISCGVLSAVLLAGCDRLTSQPTKPDAPKKADPEPIVPKSAPATKAKTPPTVKKADVVRVTAEELYREWKADQATVAGKYAGKVVRMTIVVNQIAVVRDVAFVEWWPDPTGGPRFGAIVPVGDAAGLKTGSVFVAEGVMGDVGETGALIRGRKSP